MIKIYNMELLKKRLKLTILTSTLIIGITGCRKQPQSYTTTNGDVNVTNEITNNYNVTEYNAVKKEENNTVVNNNYEENTTINNENTTIIEQENTTTIIEENKETDNKDINVLNYFRNKIIDLEDSINDCDYDTAISKCQTLIALYEEFINGEIDICGINYKNLSKENQQFICDTMYDLKDTLEALINDVHSYSNDNKTEEENSTINQLKEAAVEQLNQDIENIKGIPNLFGELIKKYKDK